MTMDKPLGSSEMFGNWGRGSKDQNQMVVVNTSKLFEPLELAEPDKDNIGGLRTKDDKKTEELYKKVRGVLNKLTPKNFITLLNQIKNFNIDTIERLQGVVDLVYEKAVDEPDFSVVYATLCSQLALMQVPAPSSNKKDGQQEFVNFRKLLVTRCQLKFEKNSIDETERNNKVKEIDECLDAEKKKDLLLDLEDYDRRLRMKSVGNIRFIGEFFKQNMLTVNIMMKCLNNLLNTKDEESLECLCKLLTTVGKELESHKKENLQPLFQTMKEISEKKDGKISNRVRFMIQDVIDLRHSKWIPRRQDLNPKTMDQIQREAETLQLNIQAMYSVPVPRREDRTSVFQHRSRNSSSTSQRNLPISTALSRPKPQPIQAEHPRFFSKPFGMHMKIKKIIGNSLNEFCTLSESDEDIKTSIPCSARSLLVSNGYKIALDRSQTARIKTGTLFAHLLKSDTLSLQDYCLGLETFLAEAEKIIIDIPNVWNYVAELITPVLCGKVVTFRDLQQPLEVITPNGHALKVLTAIFKSIIQEMGPNFLQTSWNSSGLEFSYFMQESEVDNFLKNNEFGVLLGNNNDQISPNHSSLGEKKLTYEEIHAKLLAFFQSNTPFDDITIWIKANVGESIKENQFFRVLTTAIFNYCIVNKKLKDDILEEKYNLFHYYVDNNPDYELQCLYALQTLVCKLEYPQGTDGYHVTTLPTFVQQQQTQQNNQVQPLRMPPAGPPTQSSTPPNSDLKVQSMTQEPSMNITYVPPTQVRGSSQNFFSRQNPPNTQAPRMSNHRQGQPQMFPAPSAPFVSLPAMQTTVYLNTPFYGNTTRPQGFVQGFPVISNPHIYQYTQPQSQPQAYFYSAPLMPRPPPPVATAPQNSTQPPSSNMPISQPQVLLGTGSRNRRRTNAIPIIDLTTGKDKLKELYEQEPEESLSHPPSGESSARETPQPPTNPSKEVQASFAKQVAQAISKDEVVNIVEEIEQPIIEHMGITMHPTPLNVQQRYDTLAQSSKLQTATKKFIPANATPVVSAITDAEQVTINLSSKQKDRESPAKSRKAREPVSNARDPSTKVATAPQNSTQPPPSNMPISQPQVLLGTGSRHRRIMNYIPIIDPTTGKNKLEELYEQEPEESLSHPPSGESSARETPQPPTNPSLLLQIFNKLYEDNVFSHESFLSWHSSTEPAEMEGRDLAIMQLTSFFTQLKEAEEDSSTEEIMD